MAEVKDLVGQRAILKSRLTRFKNKFNELQKDLDKDDKIITQIKFRLTNIQPVLKEYEQIHAKILKISDDPAHDADLQAFENSYYELTACVTDIIEKHAAIKTESKNVQQACVDQGSVQLPSVSLPCFNGDFENWVEFRDGFSSLVHDNKGLSDIQKFYYLISCLKGEAAQAVRSLKVSSENYPIAWELLCKRFENKKLIIQNNIKALFNLECLKRESHLSLQHFLDDILKIKQSLDNYRQPTADTLLIYILSAKLNQTTRFEWELVKPKDEFPSISEFLEFLEKRCHFLGSIEANRNQFEVSSSNGNKPHKSYIRGCVSTLKPSCALCKASHAIFECNDFLRLGVQERISQARRLHLCLNCLKGNHKTRDCTSRLCQTCNKKHNTLLHIQFNHNTNTPNQTNTNAISHHNNNDAGSRQTNNKCNNAVQNVANNDNDISINKPPQIETSHANHACNVETYQTLLSTAQIKVYDINGKTHLCRALLDPGSQSNFITEELFHKLGLKGDRLNVTVSGISQNLSNIKAKTGIHIQSCVNDFTATLSCLIIEQITSCLPNKAFDLSKLNIPSHMHLADPKCSKPGKIDILLGAGIFWKLLCVGQQQLGKNMPYMQKTRLGWIIGGTFIETENNTSQVNLCLTTNNNVDILNNNLEKFWKIEECSNNDKIYSPDEQYCEQHFVKNTTRDATGRFVVRYPLKQDITVIGATRDQAIKRFYSLERKLNRDPQLKQEYIKFLAEYESLGHMSRISNDDELAASNYYLPHHPVVKSNSLTTKLRVVFDASVKGNAGLSLNEIQYVGPTIQNDLFSILLRFRKHNFVLTGDIAKMYRQVMIQVDQRNLQIILWRPNSDKQIEYYKLNTVTYGMASAPFLAIRCLKQLAEDYHKTYVKAADIIENDFYVDDLLTGFDSRDEAIKIQREIVNILSTAKFQLRKWASNDAFILNKINIESNLEQNIINFSKEIETKTLGIVWNSQTDNFQYSLCNFTKQNQVTKRTILSIIAQIYDPLGLLAPIIIRSKLLLQKLWQCKISWDESLPLELYSEWVAYITQLSSLKTLVIPRQVTCKGAIAVELHGFCDASERAYGACIYVRSTDISGNFKVSLLCSKSRVAPLKTVTLPRLELCGAVLLAQLYHKVLQAMKITFTKCIFWCDSTIVLSWISAVPTRWKTFVSNRVAEIQTLTDTKNWKHVRTHDNPADLVSRGIEVTTLNESSLWWHGPGWLSETESQWPITCIDVKNTHLEEKCVTNLAIEVSTLPSLSKFSSFLKLQRVVAYCQRFINNLKRPPEQRVMGDISIKDMSASLIPLLKMAQRERYSSEIHCLRQGKSLDTKNSLLSLNPFLDNDGILRVGGRIQNSEFSFDKKHPIILHPSHFLTKLIFNYEHIRLLHCGPNHLLSSIRDKYWPVSGRNLARKIVHECIVCFRAKPKSISHIMGNLPKERLTPSPPFSNCGVDYAGPIFIKSKKGRGAQLIKAYICIFVCFSTKAVHLDLTNNLTSEAFLSLLRRFISRRGKPSHIYSDNGTCFKGAHNDLFEMFHNQGNKGKISNFASNNGITWHFIPPSSPHFGGLWEAGVKSIKHHLKRVTKNTNLDFEEFYTLLTQIESVLNSRPLTPLSSDPNDPEPLTPSHFLIGRKITSLPEESVLDIPENRLNKFQHIQRLLQHFWKRWSKEYVSEMQIRTKWKKNMINILKVGTLVLIREDNTPPHQWRLGRVTELHPGEDSIVRVVSIKTSNGAVLKRAVTKLCALPLPNSE